MGHQRPVFGSNVTNELDTIDTKWLKSPNLRYITFEPIKIKTTEISYWMIIL